MDSTRHEPWFRRNVYIRTRLALLGASTLPVLVGALLMAAAALKF